MSLHTPTVLAPRRTRLALVAPRRHLRDRRRGRDRHRRGPARAAGPHDRRAEPAGPHPLLRHRSQQGHQHARTRPPHRRAAGQPQLALRRPRGQQGPQPARALNHGQPRHRADGGSFTAEPASVGAISRRHSSRPRPRSRLDPARQRAGRSLSQGSRNPARPTKPFGHVCVAHDEQASQTTLQTLAPDRPAEARAEAAASRQKEQSLRTGSSVRSLLRWTNGSSATHGRPPCCVEANGAAIAISRWAHRRGTVAACARVTSSGTH